MADQTGKFHLANKGISRRSALKGIGAASAGLIAGPGFVRYAQAQSSAPMPVRCAWKPILIGAEDCACA